MRETLIQNVTDGVQSSELTGLAVPGEIEWLTAGEPVALPSFQSVDNRGVIRRLRQFAYRRQFAAESAAPIDDQPVYEDGACDEILDQAVPRRPILKAIAHGAAVFGARAAVANMFVVVAEHRFIENNWAEVPPSVTYLNHEYDPAVHDEVFFFFPGLGDVHGHKEAQEILDHGELSPDMPMAVVSLGDGRAVTRPEVVELVKQRLGDRPPKRVSMFGRSFGGPFGLAVLAEVCDDLGIKIDRFVLCSSPDEIEHGNFGSYGAALDHIPNYRCLDWLGLDAKAVASYATQIQEHGFFDFVHNYNRTKQAIKGGKSPVGLRSDVHLLADSSIHERSTLERLARVTDSRTQGKYVASRKPKSDRTVLDRASFKGFKDAFDSIGLDNFGWLSAPYLGHAKVGPTTLVLRPWFKKTNRPTTHILASK